MVAKRVLAMAAAAAAAAAGAVVAVLAVQTLTSSSSLRRFFRSGGSCFAMFKPRVYASSSVEWAMGSGLVGVDVVECSDELMEAQSADHLGPLAVAAACQTR